MANSAKHATTASATKVIAQEVSAENSPDSPVVESLRRQVANAFVLYANYKHYHWQTYGPLFRDLHKLFDKFAAAALDSLDPLAERVRMIGQDPPAHPIETMDIASVSAAAAHLSPHDMVQEADRNELIVVKEMRQAARTADEHSDPGTVDLFSRLVQVTRSTNGGCETSCESVTDCVRKVFGIVTREDVDAQRTSIVNG